MTKPKTLEQLRTEKETSVKRKAYDSTLRAVILLQNLGGNADFFVPFQFFLRRDFLFS